ncbi:MAG: hypothetical protein QF414_05690, partial [Arenicellales bacterium]|nr:hypothetical protein [Arenicellales bacterium]
MVSAVSGRVFIFSSPSMDDVSTHRMCNHAAPSTEDQTQIICPVDQHRPVLEFCVRFKHIDN